MHSLPLQLYGTNLVPLSTAILQGGGSTKIVFKLVYLSKYLTASKYVFLALVRARVMLNSVTLLARVSELERNRRSLFILLLFCQTHYTYTYTHIPEPMKSVEIHVTEIQSPQVRQVSKMLGGKITESAAFQRNLF